MKNIMIKVNCYKSLLDKSYVWYWVDEDGMTKRVKFSYYPHRRYWSTLNQGYMMTEAGIVREILLR